MAKETTTTSEAGPAVPSIAAIDIGSNAIRMAIAEILPDGRFELLEQLQRAVNFGQDTFRGGRLSEQTIRAAVAVLRDFRKLLDFYQVKQLRAVATSAVQEARNSDTFIDRVFMATGLDVEVISPSEVSRLTASAVQQSVMAVLGKKNQLAMIVEVGGGSTLLTLLNKGEISASQSIPLGSVRMQELFSIANESPQRVAEILQHQITHEISDIQKTLPINKIKTFIAIGGDARFAADQIGRADQEPDLMRVSRTRLKKLLERCETQSSDELTRTFGLPYATADTLKPALRVYLELLVATQTREMLVAQVSMRDGLLWDLVRRCSGIEDHSLDKGIIHSALTVALKYRVDLKHAKSVAQIAMTLFDALVDEHGLSIRQRLLLHIAALVHEVGDYIHTRAHHQHSFYILKHTELFGLTREEQSIVAHVARYHRRSCPKPSHGEYMALRRETRMVISKLAALLRLADALDVAHHQRSGDFRSRIQDQEFVIYLTGAADLALERRAVDMKGDLFEEVFGLKVRLEEVQLSLDEQRRAGAIK